MSKYADSTQCIGNYSEGDYVCVTACLCHEECLMVTIGTMPVAKLLEFLSHPNANVRKRAKSELERAMSKHFTKPPPKAKGSTKIVRGAPVKVSRARAGSMGKSVEEELVDMPDGNWVEPEELEVFAHQRQNDIRSGFDVWAAPITEKIKRVDDAEDVGELAEGLADEHDIVRDKADEKLRKLQKDQKEKSRFDTIDLDLEDD